MARSRSSGIPRAGARRAREREVRFEERALGAGRHRASRRDISRAWTSRSRPSSSATWPGTEDPRKREITIGHLLSMQSGLERTSGAFYGRWVTSPDWVRYAITRPDGGRAGRAAPLQHRQFAPALRDPDAGDRQSTWAYARARLAEPLGITLPRWPADPQGIYFGGNEMRLTRARWSGSASCTATAGATTVCRSYRRSGCARR
jgi:hypothetical protein